MPDSPSDYWAGAWPWDLHYSFYTLTDDPTIKGIEAARTVGELAGLAASRQKRIDELINRVHAHECYQRLKRLPGFAPIMAERARLAESNALFAEPFGEIRLVHAIAAIVGAHDRDFAPKKATRTQKRKVLKLTRELRDALMPGAQPANVFEMSDLRRLLATLETELHSSISAAEQSGRRPARSDKDAAQRYWIGGFCDVLLESFGEAPPAIVKEVAAMLEYEPDDSTVARYIKRAGRERRKRALVSALMSSPPQISPKTRG